ncbi:MAG: M48 family metalloprotease [Kiritimatiellae bacterium]|nr:M48 family metalloprotease [Kiritimatiellia bacterium]
MDKAERVSTMAGERVGIGGAVADEILRLALFLVYYISLICLGAAIIVGALFAAKFIVFEGLEHVRDVRSALFMIVVAIGLLSLAAVFGVYLVKPLFSFTKNRNEERLEVCRADCPVLFDLVERLSKETGFRMPRHVYLTTDVNAGVFYNTAFWSIFFPVRKNLEIGLGLFNSTSVQEVKAILAHEFGHFGQSSMKVGAAVSVTYQILYNLVYTDDFIDRALDSWRSAGWTAWRIFGVLAYRLTSFVKHITVHVFRFVMRGERKLSRLMEFGADEVACKCAGTDAFVSAMCKVEQLSWCDMECLRPFLARCLEGGELPENYFKSHEAVAEVMSRWGMMLLKPGETMAKPFDLGLAKSRIKAFDVWSSHPELSDRLDRARKLDVMRADVETSDAWSMVPRKVAEKVSEKFFVVATASLEKKPQRMTAEAFRNKLFKFCDENMFPKECETVFNRRFEPFDLQEAFGRECAENPFTPEYRRLVGELNAAQSDMATLEQIASGEMDVGVFAYNGEEYTRKTVPLEDHKKYLAYLGKLVAEKDSLTCSFLSHLGGEASRARVRSLYVKMSTIESVVSRMEKTLAAHDAWLNQRFATGGNMSKTEYFDLCCRVVALEKDFQRGVGELMLAVPDIIPDSEAGRFVAEYTKRVHNTEFDFGPKSFEELQHCRSLFRDMCYGYHQRCMLALARLAHENTGCHSCFP